MSSRTSSPTRRYAALERFTAMAEAETALAALKDDPIAFAAACGIESLDDWQRDVLSSDARRILLCCSRQSGKSLVCALLALHCATFSPGATVLVVARAERQSQELFLKVLTLLSGLAAHSGEQFTIPVDGESALQLRLSNGARILALPGNAATVRSYRADLLIIDEAAQVKDETYMSLVPMLAVSGGRLVLASSPFGKRGFYYEAWRDDGQGEIEPWLKVRITAEQCPRIPASFLAEQRRTMGKWWFESEFMAIFHAPISAVFDPDMIDRMFAEDYPVWPLDELAAASSAEEKRAVIEAYTGDVRHHQSAQQRADEESYGGVQVFEIRPPEPAWRAPTIPGGRPVAAVEAERAADPVWSRYGRGSRW